VFQRYGYIVPGAVEIFQTPQEADLCTPSNRGPHSGTSGSFRLPSPPSDTPNKPDIPDTPGKPEPQ